VRARNARLCAALWHNITLETRVEFSPVCKVSDGTWSAVPHFFIFPGA